MIEEKVNFISTDNFYSQKKEKEFWVVYVVLDHKPVTYFVTREVYDKINLKKLKELAECTAVLETTVIGSRINATLVDIK